MTISIPSDLSDLALIAEVRRLARCAREATAALVAHLAELDARRLYLGAGFPSLFAYCTGVLRLSEHGTYNRIEAARAARRVPVILEMLGDGSLNLATLRLLAPHLTTENHRELLGAASGKSKREVEDLMARHFPRPEVPALIRKLPVRPRHDAVHLARPDEGGIPLSKEPVARSDQGRAPSGGVQQAKPDEVRGRSGETWALAAVAADEEPLEPSRSSARPTVSPLAPDRYQIRFTASAETHRKLRQVQELLGHAIPDGGIAAIFDKAITLLRDELTRRKLGATNRRRAGCEVTSGSRHIPAQVRRAVWDRDGGRCAFVARDGQRCTARRFLEFHHVQPYGVGGRGDHPQHPVTVPCSQCLRGRAVLRRRARYSAPRGNTPGVLRVAGVRNGGKSPRGEFGDAELLEASGPVGCGVSSSA